MRQHLAGGRYEFNTKNQRFNGRDVYVLEYKEIKKSDRVNSDGRACYLERNQWMIESSNFVVIKYKQIQTKQKNVGQIVPCNMQKSYRKI